MSDGQREFEAGALTFWGVRCDIRVVVDVERIDQQRITVKGGPEFLDNLTFQVQNQVLGIDGDEREPTSGNGELRVIVPPHTKITTAVMEGELRLDTDLLWDIRGMKPTYVPNDA